MAAEHMSSHLAEHGLVPTGVRRFWLHQANLKMNQLIAKGVLGRVPNEDEAPVILNLIRKLKDDKRKTILLVEHKMDVVRELADRIIVLHNGTLVADGEPAEVIASPVVQEAYLGVSKEAA